MQKPFEDTAFALRIHELSGVVNTSSGSHILLRIDGDFDPSAKKTDVVSEVRVLHVLGAWIWGSVFRLVVNGGLRGLLRSIGVYAPMAVLGCPSEACWIEEPDQS